MAINTTVMGVNTMNIPTSNVRTVDARDHHAREVKGEPGKWVQLLNAVKNNADNFSSLRPHVVSLTQSATIICEALGINKMIEGLAWVRNAFEYAEQAYQKAANLAQVVKTGITIAEDGVAHFGHTLALTLKQQAIPIVKCTLNSVIKAGPQATKGEAFASLMACIMANPGIVQFFRDISRGEPV